MATKPIYKPLWAQNDTTLPNAGTDNKLRPTSDLRDAGIDYGQQLTAQEFNWIVNNIREWIDYLESDSGIQDAAVADNTDGDAVEATLGVDSYNSEDIYWIEWPNNNTVSTPTLNINGNGAITVISLDGDALEAGDLVGGRLYPFWYDGANFVVCSVLKASQTDAEGHTDDKQYMTALKVYQAFSQYGLGSTSLPYISDFNNAYQLETGFYHWDGGTVGEPTGGALFANPATVLLMNENGVASLIAFKGTVLYTAFSSSNTTLSPWYEYKQGQVIDTQTFSSVGSFSWSKPAGANPDDTVVARIWAAGGSGASAQGTSPISATGGNGGGYLEISFRASDMGSTEPVAVGEGASAQINNGNGFDGGDSSFAGFIARGGKGGVSAVSDNASPADNSGFSWPNTTFELIPAEFTPGQGGEIVSTSVSPGDDSFNAGAGGGSAYTVSGGNATPESTGGTSYYGGDGGDGFATGSTDIQGNPGTAPGGGGGAGVSNSGGASSGAGADGLVEVYVIRGWSPSGITADI